MRCICCNRILTTQESRTKFAVSGNFTETCYHCLDTMDVKLQYPPQELHNEDDEGFYDIPKYDDEVPLDNNLEDYWDER